MPDAAGDEAVLARWEPVIGLEVHCQLGTASKIFCSCRNRFGDPPNTNVCPVCLGLPGALPVLNRHAVTLAIRAALAIRCTVHARSIFARKNYFYPDLPKGYQISQFERPLATGGYLEVPSGPELRRVGLRRIHLEEDAGKLLHEGFPWSGDKSGIDLNRAGVPLIEIVSEPDIRSSAEAHEYLAALKAVLVYCDVSECNMEQGSLRCDANVSLRPRGGEALGTRTEIKNLNSFRNVARALDHEIRRQAAVLESGAEIVQETRLWDPERGETAAMRSKEESHDYRYFPEPDLPPLVVGPEWVEEVAASLPELPADRRRRFCREYGLPEYDATVLTLVRETAEYFEAVARESGDAKAASNWVMTEVLRRLKQEGVRVPVPPGHLAEVIRMIAEGRLSGTLAKDLFERMWTTGEEPRALAEREGLVQVSDEAALRRLVEEVVSANPEQVATYRSGKKATLGWFVGQVMRRTGGKANPRILNRLLEQALGGD